MLKKPKNTGYKNQYKKSKKFICNSCGMGVEDEKECAQKFSDVTCCGKGVTPLKLLVI